MSRRPPPFDYRRLPDLPQYPTRRPARHDRDDAWRESGAAGYGTPLSRTRLGSPYEYWTPASLALRDSFQHSHAPRDTPRAASQGAWLFAARLARLNRWIARHVPGLGGYRAQR